MLPRPPHPTIRYPPAYLRIAARYSLRRSALRDFDSVLLLGVGSPTGVVILSAFVSVVPTAVELASRAVTTILPLDAPLVFAASVPTFHVTVPVVAPFQVASGESSLRMVTPAGSTSVILTSVASSWPVFW